MNPLPRAFIILSAFCAVHMGALAQDCRGQSNALASTNKVLETQQTDLIARAADVEAAGEVWENAASMATLGGQYASEARAKQTSFETLKSNFEAAQARHLALAESHNIQIQRFNATCAKTKR